MRIIIAAFLWGRLGQSRFPGKGGELAGVGGNVVRLQLFQSEQKVERTYTNLTIQMQGRLAKDAFFITFCETVLLNVSNRYYIRL